MNNEISKQEPVSAQGYGGQRQVIVIHGGDVWDTNEEYIEYLKNYDFTREKFDKITSRGWKDNLQEDLGNDFQIVKPDMPSKRNAKYYEWNIWFQKIVPYLDDNVVLVGHSLGATFLVKYLAENKLSVNASQLHLVAGVFGYKGGFGLPRSFELIEQQSKNIFLYHSKDDVVVDFEDALKFQNVLQSAKLVQFEDRSHFNQARFPEIVENIKKV
ncbi:MAG: alpha/beta hydrolase [Patescibacteria group bacterium]|nr:alpha/beta hydrolase [Patescibacteria group bacterium]